MDFFLSAESTAHKFLLMFLVMALFIIVMGAILFAVDRPKLPRWVPLIGFGTLAVFRWDAIKT